MQNRLITPFGLIIVVCFLLLGSIYQNGIYAQQPNLVYAFDINQAGTLYAVGYQDRTIEVIDLASNQVVFSVQAPDLRLNSFEIFNIRRLIFSPNGEKLAVGLGGTAGRGLLLVIDVDTEAILLQLVEGEAINGIDWSPDGTQLIGFITYNATTKANSNLTLWNATSGQALNEELLVSVGAYTLDWHPTQSKVAYVRRNKQVVIWDVANWQELAELSGHVGYPLDVTWSPDGSRLASSAADGQIILWDAVSGQSVLTISGGASEVTTLSWSPDGSKLASGRADGKIAIWNTATGQQITQFQGMGPIYDIVWHPDGSELFYLDLGNLDTIPAPGVTPTATAIITLTPTPSVLSATPTLPAYVP